MKQFEDRTLVVQINMNPAYLGEVLRRVLVAYGRKARSGGMEFALVFLVLPLVLHRDTRLSFPLKTNKYFSTWMAEHPEIQLALGQRVRKLVPYTREALAFMILHSDLIIDKDGNVSIAGKNHKNISERTETDSAQLIVDAEKLGKWMAGFPDAASLYSALNLTV